MGIYENLILPEDDQWDTLWDFGKYLTHRIKEESKYVLYAMDMFFVEVELDGSDKIVGKKVFRHGHNLDNYSPDISIS